MALVGKQSPKQDADKKSSIETALNGLKEAHKSEDLDQIE